MIPYGTSSELQDPQLRTGVPWRSPEQREEEAELFGNPEERQRLLAERKSHEDGKAVRPSSSQDTHRSLAELPAFPKAAWRGLFAQYRDVMRTCSEASDVYHFAALWAAAGNALGRHVHFPYGMPLCANVYIIAFGPTGDFKTSACRRAPEMAEAAGFRVVHGVGSGEGITSGLGEEPTLFFLEEFTSLLRQGKWDGSTLLPTLTAIFDCPEKYEREYRKNPISLRRPVCSILAATTEAWFWRDVREIDFEGGFGNRFVYMAGPPNEPLAGASQPSVCNQRASYTEGIARTKGMP